MSLRSLRGGSQIFKSFILFKVQELLNAQERVNTINCINKSSDRHRDDLNSHYLKSNTMKNTLQR